MNTWPFSCRVPVALGLGLGTMLVLSGCVNLPPAVTKSVDNSREAVAQLHLTHAQDARALAGVVNRREAILKDAGAAVRKALRAQLEAEIAASKTRVMAEFDRRAGDLLGIQFQAKLKKQVFPKFDALERTNLLALLEALRNQVSHPTDAYMQEKVLATQKEIFKAQTERENVVAEFYLALHAGLSNARFKFETDVDEKYVDTIQPLLAVLVTETDAADKSLQEFNQRVDQRLAQLDESYNSLDQALSDLSTFLDSEATSRRFAAHFAKGAAAALVDDLKDGQLAGAALSDLLNKKAPGFMSTLKRVEDTMKSKAEEATQNAAARVPTPAPTGNPPSAT